MDLYANERQTFLRVTFPLVAPGIARGRAAGLRAVVRRLHHHELQRVGLVGDLPDVRLGRRQPRNAGADQRDRHGHVPAGAVRGRRRPAAAPAEDPPREGLTSRPAGGASRVATSSNAAVCASTSASVVVGAISAMLWNGVSSSRRLSACRCSSVCSAKSSASAASCPVRGGSGAKAYSARAPSRVTCQGSAVAAEHLGDAVGPALPERQHARVGLVGEHLGQGGPHRGQRQRVAGERAADAADVDVLELDRPADAVGQLARSGRRHRTGCRRRSPCPS